MLCRFIKKKNKNFSPEDNGRLLRLQDEQSPPKQRRRWFPIAAASLRLRGEEEELGRRRRCRCLPLLFAPTTPSVKRPKKRKIEAKKKKKKTWLSCLNHTTITLHQPHRTPLTHFINHTEHHYHTPSTTQNTTITLHQPHRTPLSHWWGHRDAAAVWEIFFCSLRKKKPKPHFSTSFQIGRRAVEAQRNSFFSFKFERKVEKQKKNEKRKLQFYFFVVTRSRSSEEDEEKAK